MEKKVSPTNKQANNLKEQVSAFPLAPGVYIMKNTSMTTLYIGKAKILRQRVQSYLRTQNSGKVAVLMSHVHTIEYIVTENEYDALLLEHNLIKEHQPKYNILLRDDKTFPMIKITHEEYPRLLKTRKISNDKAEYFGPYIDVFLMNTYIDLIEKNFALRRCNKIKKRAHPCLYYHLGRCTAVCAGLTSKTEYLARIKKIRSLLKGRTKTLKKNITVQMHSFATEKKYEQAAQQRDTLAALESLDTQQHMIDYQTETRNYIGIASRDNKCCIVVVHMKEGRVFDQHTTHLSTFDSIQDSLEQFFLSYYYEQMLFPEIIFSPLAPSEEIISFFSKHNTKILTPIESRDAAIIRFAKDNAYFGLTQHIKARGDSESVLCLQNTLGLKTPPMRIEGFDIATMHGHHTTASMVSFFNGVPDKSKYRHFNIKSLEKGTVDDYWSIQEAVSRRYSKLKNEKLPLPNLILIDGGIGQVNSAKEVLDILELNIPIIGLAKKEEEIYFPGKISRSMPTNPLQIPLNDPASKLLQFIRNEAHRFATSFREKKQINELQLGLYKEVRGIGEKKSVLIAKLFPTSQDIIDASLEMLATSLKISPLTAKILQEYAQNNT